MWGNFARLGVVLAAIPACFVSIDFGGTEYQCPDGECPDGYDCVAGTCVAGFIADAGADSGTDGGVANLECGDPQLIATSFENGAPWWAFANTQNGGSVSYPSGRLRVDAPPLAGDLASQTDRYHTSLAGNRHVVRIADISNAEPKMYVEELGRTSLTVVGQMLIGEIRESSGQTSSATVPYDPIAHTFFSIGETDGVVFTEVSSDAVTWETVHSRAVSQVERVGHLSLEARSLGSAGYVEYDDLNGGTPIFDTCRLTEPERFDDSLVDDVFAIYFSDCASAISAGSLRFDLSLAGGTEPFCAFEPTYRTDFRNSSVGMEIREFPLWRDGMFMFFAVEGEGGSAAFFLGDGVVNADYCDSDGCTSTTTATLDPVAHRFWRFRHDDEIHQEFSADGVNWLPFVRLGSAFNPSVVQVRFQFGANAGGPGSIEIDNFGPMP